MNKHTKRTDSIRTLLVKKLAAEHNCTTAHVYSAIRGDVKTEDGDTIKKKYEVQYTVMQKLATPTAATV